jgi:hypothetical protein
MKQADLGNMFKKASKSICTSIIVISPDPVSPSPSASMVETKQAPETYMGTLNVPEPAAKGDTQMEYSAG